jgi:hypothetical protein
MVWKYNIVTLDRLILCLVSFYLAVLSWFRVWLTDLLQFTLLCFRELHGFIF